MYCKTVPGIRGFGILCISLASRTSNRLFTWKGKKKKSCTVLHAAEPLISRPDTTFVPDSCYIYYGNPRDQAETWQKRNLSLSTAVTRCPTVNRATIRHNRKIESLWCFAKANGVLVGFRFSCNCIWKKGQRVANRNFKVKQCSSLYTEGYWFVCLIMWFVALFQEKKCLFCSKHECF